MGFFDEIKQSLTRTKQQFVERFEESSGARTRPSSAAARSTSRRIDALEEALISADVGVAATERIVAAVAVARPPRRSRCASSSRRRSWRFFARADVAAGQRPSPARRADRRRQRHRQDDDRRQAGAADQGVGGQTPLICAADTFRAAAVEQLEIWATRAGVDIIRARAGADPAAVVFDAMPPARRAAATSCSSTPPGACTRA